MRSHAVAVLQQKDDEELLYYLLQLVQVRAHWDMIVSGARISAVRQRLLCCAFMTRSLFPPHPAGAAL